jgi:6-phosphogluconolactonase
MTMALRVYVGCSTNESSVGIHVFELERTARGATLLPRAQVDDVEHPTFLAAHPAEPVLYAVSETVDGELVAFHLEPDGTLVEWQRVPSAGDGPCHLAADGARLYVANYISGSAAAYALHPDGRIADLVWSEQHQGSGPHVRQDGPHAHCAVPDPHRPSVHIVDLGTDRVVRYDADLADGGFHRATELVLVPGSGPRHLVFHPHEPMAFVVCELDSTLVALDIDSRTGELVPRQTSSTLPDGFAGDSLAAAVRVHPDGRRVFVSNRGHDSIAVFEVGGPDAPLVSLGHVASGGSGPRDFTLDPSGELLLTANGRTGEIAAFALDDPHGLPRPLGIVARVHEPASILVLEADR